MTDGELRVVEEALKLLRSVEQYIEEDDCELPDPVPLREALRREGWLNATKEPA